MNTSIGNLTDSSPSLLVYPNPTSKEVTIAINVMDEKASIAIYSMEGTTILKKENTNPSILTSINLDGLAKGTYLLVVTTKNSIERKKIVIR